MKDLQKYLSMGVLAAAALLGGASPAWAAVAPPLGAASSFAVLSAGFGGTGAVTCTNSSITGDVGSSGNMASVTQTGCAIVGSVIAPVSTQVLADFNTAYSQYAAIPCTGTLNAAYTNAALTLTPGVYCSAAAVTFTDSTLTLDAQGVANAVWIFKIGTGGTGALTGTNFSVLMANGGQACNVDWWVAQAVTTTTSGFQGNILAGAAITLTGLAGSTTPFNGDALAKAAVTLTDVTVKGCGASGGHGQPPGKCDKDNDKDNDKGHGKGHGKDNGKDNGKGHDKDNDKDNERCDRDDDDHSAVFPFGRHSDDERGEAPGNRKGGNRK